MEIDEVQAGYESARPKYEQLKGEIIYILESALAQRGIAIHVLEGRIKPVDSLIAKMERQETEPPFEEIVDICGIRIIGLFLSDIQEIGKLLEETFDLESTDDKITAKPHEEFGYLSVHYVARLPDSFSGPRYDGIKGLRFEVQVRTIAMHDWATISHYLDYKSPNAIPSNLHRDFNALSAMFYVADSHFELFFSSSQQARLQAEQKAQIANTLGTEEINLDTLTAYLKKKYPTRDSTSSVGISDLVEELVSSGYQTISRLDSDLDRSKEAFIIYEAENPPRPGPQYADVGVVRLVPSIANEEFLSARGQEALTMAGRYRQYRSHVIDSDAVSA